MSDDFQKILNNKMPKIGDLVNIFYQVTVPKNIYNNCIILEITESKKDYPQYTFNTPEFIYKALYKNQIKEFKETHVSIYVTKRLVNE